MRRLLLALAAVCLALILGLRRRDQVSPPIVPTAASNESQPPLSTTAASTRSFVGFVVDEHGRGIAGANVCARGEGSFLSDAERAAVCVRAGDDGGFTFTTPPMVLKLVASAPGYLPRTTIVQDLDHPASIALAHGGAKIGGKITDPLGRPVANARVEAEGATDGATDGDGVYELWTAPGVATLHVTADGYADQELEGFAPSEGNDLKLEWGSTIVGRARPHAWVSTYAERGGEKSVRADDTGAFRIAGLASGRYVVEARSPGNYGRFATVALGVGEISNEIEIPFEPAHDVAVLFTACKSGRAMLFPDRPHGAATFASFVLGSARILSLPRGRYVARVSCDDGIVASSQTVDVEDTDISLSFVAEVGVPVSGAVVDESGQPLAFAKVIARSANVVSSETTADAKGIFAFTALPTAKYVFSAEHADALDTAQSIHVEGPMRGVRLELSRGVTLTGRTIDAKGKPVAGLRVEACGRVGRSGPDGRFTLTHVSLGDYRVVATRGARTLGATPVLVSTSEGATTDVVVDDENDTLSGRVVDETGAPVVEALIETSLDDGSLPDPTLRTLTDADGRFTVDRVTHATHAIRATRRGHAPGFVTVDPGEPTKLVLGPPSSIAGTIDLPAGEHGWVWLTCKPHTRESTLVASDGTFAFDDLAAGTCRLEINVGAKREERTIHLKSGEIARPSFHFESVTDESSAPSAE